MKIKINIVYIILIISLISLFFSVNNVIYHNGKHYIEYSSNIHKHRLIDENGKEYKIDIYKEDNNHQHSVSMHVNNHNLIIYEKNKEYSRNTIFVLCLIIVGSCLFIIDNII